MSKKSHDQQREWARLGAAARLLEIKEETAAILSAFPELRRQGAGPAVAAATSGRKKKRSISPAGRKKMSEGMRKYWARRKAAQKKG